MDEYLNAKLRLVHKTKKYFIINNNDKNAPSFISEAKNNGLEVITYGDDADLSIKIKSVDTKDQNFSFTIDGQAYDIQSPINGEFQIYNLALAFLGVKSLGFKSNEIAKVISKLKSPIGRLERIIVNSEYTNIYVDYAHTPDALEKALITLRKVANNGKLIALFGCGGNRDKTKRPIMANIASAMSDKAIFTSDNPRTENPETIIEEMEKGVEPQNFKKTVSILDRKQAIKTACQLANPNDIILIAGKGHETYQEINGVRHDFDDLKIVTELLQQLNK
jgi:UDP-N-acetylmuramoyl-L-alanyl-D-glutamate--2,6-diaminopimelate ligase